uniref:Uncharacterized protein n=1 Tax=Rhizophora mucronata TaxID=61149 RepID=A0A2P2QVQ8_RHIMU
MYLALGTVWSKVCLRHKLLGAQASGNNFMKKEDPSVTVWN